MKHHAISLLLAGFTLLYFIQLCLAEPMPGVWMGKTDQGKFVYFIVSDDSKAVTRFEASVTADCAAGGMLTTSSSTTGRVTIVEDHFNIVAQDELGLLEYNGTFASATAADGTWMRSASHPVGGYCFGSGTWEATAGGRWLELDGIDDYAWAPHSDSLNVGDELSEIITIEAWVYPQRWPEQVDGEYAIACIAGKVGSYTLALYNSEEHAQGFIFYIGELGLYVWDMDFETDRWYHLAGVFDDANNIIALCIDGEERSLPFNLSMPESNSEFLIGKPTMSEYQYAFDSEYFQGKIDELRISSVRRYNGDFDPPTERFSPDAYTRALWHFDEEEGAIILHDASTFKNDLTYVGGEEVDILTTSPNGGEKWRGGSSQNITWQTSGLGIDHIHLQYSADGGASYQDIVPSTSNDSSYQWTVPDTIDSSNVYIMVFAEDASNNALDEDTNDSPFTIDSAEPAQPVISSSTHPEYVWRDDKSPCFEWTEPSDLSGVNGYSYVFDQASNTVPDKSSEGTSRTKCYSDKDDGEWYFHVRARDGAGWWGQPDHYGPVRIDTNDRFRPIISSNTHPEGVWVGDKNPCFEWTKPYAPSDIAGYRYILDHLPDTVPDEVSEATTVRSKCYLDVDDGEWYFHVRARTGSGIWGDTDHYGPVRIGKSFIHVAITGDDTMGNGTQEKPYRTIQRGIDKAKHGDTVLVCDGTYTGLGNVKIDFRGKAITVRSENGARNCIIDCEWKENTWGFSFHSGEDSDSVLDGFTIKKALFATVPPNDGGRGIHCSGSSPTIMNNVIMSNKTSDGAGIYCSNSSPVIANNVITRNEAIRGAIYCSTGSAPMIVNNTIAGNASVLGGGIFCIGNSSLMVINTILWDESQDKSQSEIYIDGSSAIDITYSDVKGGWPGEGNMDVDPRFTDEANGDYCLQSSSLCIGAGIMTPDVPNTDILGNPRPNPSHCYPDIGACESSLCGRPDDLPDKPVIYSSTHPKDIWSNNDDPCFEWTEPYDLSGITGYSYVLDHSPGTTPDETSEGTGRSKCYTDVESGEWFFHVRARDGAGNWGEAGHYGTVRIRSQVPEIHLNEGWNLISLPLEPEDTDPGAVLSSISGKYNSVWAYHPDIGWAMYAPGVLSDLDSLVAGKGYWIKMSDAADLALEGNVPEQTSISLRGNAWNLVGYISIEERDVEGCMSGVKNYINSVWEYGPHSAVAGEKDWSIYVPGGPSDLGIMKPGYGYWIKAEGNCSWDPNSP